jgi:hypothetical protein
MKSYKQSRKLKALRDEGQRTEMLEESRDLVNPR